MKMCKSLFVAMAVAVAAWAQDEMGPVESPAVEMPMMSAPQNPNPALAAEPVAPAKKTRVKKVRPPHEHRGFFFSMGMGVSYVTTSVDESNVENSSSGGGIRTWMETLFLKASMNVKGYSMRNFPVGPRRLSNFALESLSEI